jgi:hypothetical protein
MAHGTREQGGWAADGHTHTQAGTRSPVGQSAAARSADLNPLASAAAQAGSALVTGPCGVGEAVQHWVVKIDHFHSVLNVKQTGIHPTA